MSDNTYKGIVLRAVKYGEHDKMLTIFTLEKGKISAVAKGAQNTKSKFLASAQPFALSEFVLSERKVPYVSSAELIKGFFDLKKDISILSAASYILQLTDVIFEEEAEDDMAFRLIYFTLCKLESSPIEYSLVIASAFALKLMGISGFAPILECCIECMNECSEYFFHYGEGGLICSNCINDKSMPIVTLGEAEYLKDLLYTDITKLDSLPVIDKSNQKYLFKIINNYVVYTIGKNIKSFDMLYSLY